MILGAGLGLMRSSPVGGGGGLLLDQFPGASVAYSLRLLSNTYSGDCVKVRRDSDNTEQSIGFSGGVVDMASITTFCGGAGSGIGGFVSVWYDQSGNALDITQAVSTSQMQIVSDGDSFYLWNGHPRIYEAGRKAMYTIYFTLIPTGWSGTNFSCAYPGGHNNFWGLYTGTNALYNGVYGGTGAVLKMNEYYTPIVTGTIMATASEFNLVTSVWNDTPGDCELFVNGVSDGSVDTYSPINYSRFSIPYSISTDEADPVELIFYPSDVGADRSGIETNIIDYYGI